MKISAILLCIPIALIAITVSYSEKVDTTIETTSSTYSDATGKCDYVIDIFSWKAMYFTKPPTAGPDLRRFIADRKTTEYIILENISPSTTICVRKYLDCELSDDKISNWLKAIGISKVIIEVLPYGHEKEEEEMHKRRLVPLAI